MRHFVFALLLPLTRTYRANICAAIKLLILENFYIKRYDVQYYALIFCSNHPDKNKRYFWFYHKI